VFLPCEEVSVQGMMYTQGMFQTKAMQFIFLKFMNVKNNEMLNKVLRTDANPYSSSTSSTGCFKPIPVLRLIKMRKVLWNINTPLTGK
jgi:hypothetical protein